MPATIPRTLEGVRQAIYAALTTPLLAYNLWDGATFAAKTLPATSVVPKAQWNVGGAEPPSPLVAYVVGKSAPLSRYHLESVLTAKISISSSSSSDEVSEIAEGVNARLNFADQEGGPYAGAISRAGAAGYLPAIFREIKITRQSDPAFEEKTNRWYVIIEYHIVAI